MSSSESSIPSLDQSGQAPTRRKLVVVSNRLPVSLRVDESGVEAFPSSGGLATAMSGLTDGDSDLAWIGWPGCAVPETHRPEAERILAGHGLIPIHLEADEEGHYYRGTCNQVLWPLFHYFSGHVSFASESWDHYVRINDRFAQKVAEHAAEGAQVWIHDFHLMLVPGALRALRPDLQIGFFLHIPFPSSELYRLLPTRSTLLRGVLGADYIGFHTSDYARHFRSACLRVLGLDSNPDSISYEGRQVGIGTDPIGIDVEGFRETMNSEKTADAYSELEMRYEGRRLILGVERLDYTKGVLHKLQAFERYLERDPSRAETVTMLQVLVPSRLSHPEYQELKSEIERYVGRINGRFSTPANTPVEYMHRSIPPEQLVALYHRADAMFVLPVRDGMNLVAQEFVLCQDECRLGDPFRGILVLSEFAGAAHYLSRSILVNPWNVDRSATALERALQMSDKERVDRMSSMVARVADLDCHRWASTYLRRLTRYADRNRTLLRHNELDDTRRRTLCDAFSRAPKRMLFLDYDGTLREIMRQPEDAEPTAEILELLTALASLPNTEVHLVSGRGRATMEVWFQDLPVHLCAEHGYVARAPGADWELLHQVDLSWMPRVAATLETVASEVPGAMVEQKSCALAWHYRMAELDYGVWRARELMSWLEENLANQPLEVIPGHRVIEVRASGVNKGGYVGQRLADESAETFVFCAGDDRTDHDMFRVLPQSAHSVFVGTDGADTDFSVPSPAKLRGLLESFRDSMQVDRTLA